MEIIGLFFPALVSLKFSIGKGDKEKRNTLDLVIKYGIYVLINTGITQMIITYVLNVSDVTADAFNSFPFFIKYIAIALIIAVAIPYCEKLLKLFFGISVETGVHGDANNYKNKKSD